MKTIVIIFLATILFGSNLGWAESKIDINTASAEMLVKHINGVGPKLAKAIIEYRDQNGRFQKVEDLKKIKGIAERLLKKNREILSVGEN